MTLNDARQVMTTVAFDLTDTDLTATNSAGSYASEPRHPTGT